MQTNPDTIEMRDAAPFLYTGVQSVHDDNGKQSSS